MPSTLPQDAKRSKKVQVAVTETQLEEWRNHVLNTKYRGRVADFIRDLVDADMAKAVQPSNGHVENAGDSPF